MLVLGGTEGGDEVEDAHLVTRGMRIESRRLRAGAVQLEQTAPHRRRPAGVGGNSRPARGQRLACELGADCRRQDELPVAALGDVHAGIGAPAAKSAAASSAKQTGGGVVKLSGDWANGGCVAALPQGSAELTR